MKYFVQILFFLTFSIKVKAQNLITNPSFEEIDSCYGQPAGIGFDVFEWAGCTGWSCPIASSSDLWCENPIIGTNTPPLIAGLGYQQPRTGKNMAAIKISDGAMLSYREFIQNKLAIPLNNNSEYLLTFYHSPISTDCLSNQFGVYLSTQKMDDQTIYFLSNLQPIGISDTSLFEGDTTNWNYSEIRFKSNGGEQFIIFGNFQDSTNVTYANPCDTSFWGNVHYGGGYFFIDDFTLELVPSELTIPNIFTPNQDGSNDLFVPFVINYPNWKITILNRWGNIVANLNETNPNWDGDKTPDGVYFYRFECIEKNKFEENFISIFR